MKSSQKDKEKGTYYTLYRALDAEIARWHQYDPKATPFESPYSSMANNPIMFNDPLGDVVKYRGKGARKAVRKARRLSKKGDGKWNEAFEKLKQDEDVFYFKASKRDNAPIGAENSFDPDKVLNGEPGNYQIGESYKGNNNPKDQIYLRFRVPKKESRWLGGVGKGFVFKTKKPKSLTTKKYFKQGYIVVSGTSNVDEGYGKDTYTLRQNLLNTPPFYSDKISLGANKGLPYNKVIPFNFEHKSKITITVFNENYPTYGPLAFYLKFTIYETP